MTKRKSSEAVVPRSKPKKRVAFTVPKNAATKALYASPIVHGSNQMAGMVSQYCSERIDLSIATPSTRNSQQDLDRIRSFSGLRALRLQIIHDMEAGVYRRVAKEEPEFPQGTFWADGLQKLSVLPLARIEVAARGSELAKYRLGPGQWTEQDRKELAGRLRAMLLNPKGAEAYAEYQEKEKELSRRLTRGETWDPISAAESP
ncbi:MAG: hypothetical protein Q9194_004155 [Teloschistes cf. exilis]